MAVDLAQGDVLEVRLAFQSPASRAYNILHYQVASVTVNATSLPAAIRIPLTPQVNQLGPDVLSAFGEAWKSLASNEVLMTDVTIQSVYIDPRSRPFTYTPAAEIRGTIDDDCLPLQDCPTILKRTLIGQRWGLGRVFVPGVPETGQNDGILTNALVDSLNDYSDVFANLFTVNDGTYTTVYRPVLYTPQAGVAPRVTVITDAELSDRVLKTQRRRRPGKGE